MIAVVEFAQFEDIGKIVVYIRCGEIEQDDLAFVVGQTAFCTVLVGQDNIKKSVVRLGNKLTDSGFLFGCALRGDDIRH